MPQQARVSVTDTIYHVINRANGRVQIFNTSKEYLHFESLMLKAKEIMGMRVLAYCIMPNHFHFMLYQRTDHDLATSMGWLTTTHVRQYRTGTETIGHGHVYQDRYKSFLVESSEYVTTLMRYIEQNPSVQSRYVVQRNGVGPVCGGERREVKKTRSYSIRFR